MERIVLGHVCTVSGKDTNRMTNCAGVHGVGSGGDRGQQPGKLYMPNKIGLRAVLFCK
jgi:hypothetical protein